MNKDTIANRFINNQYSEGEVVSYEVTGNTLYVYCLDGNKDTYYFEKGKVVSK